MQHTTAAPSMRPSSQRPVPLRMRQDIIVEEIRYKGVPYPVVKDPCGLKYYRLQPEQYGALNLLDGERSLDEVRDELQKQFPATPFTLRSVQQLIQDLHEKGLLMSERPGRAIGLQHTRKERKWKEFWNVIRNPLYIRLPGWDPERFLQFMYPFIRWVFHPFAVICILTLVFSSWIFLAMRFGEVRSKLPEFQQFFGWPNLMYLWATLAFAKIMHEFGHAFSCKHFGGECHGIGVMLLVFSPTLYCDVTDSWMLKNKWQRIFIGAAGMYVEIVLASIAIFTWWYAKPGMVQHLCLNLFFVSTVTTVIFNANPLLRFDGYYMLADLLEIPNLRQKASTMLQHTFAWYCLGIEMPEDPFMPKAGKGWFIFYAIASSLYRWFVLFGITIFLYTVLKPYRLQSIGIILAVVSMGAVFINLGWSVVKIIRMPRQESMSAVKVATTLTVLALLLAAAVMIPFPWFTQAAFVIEPIDVRDVYAQTPGVLKEIRVKPGDHVEEGDLLVVLDSPELEDSLRELKSQLRLYTALPGFYERVGDTTSRMEAISRRIDIEFEIREIETQMAQLEITAPTAGIIVEPPRVQEPTLDRLDEQLPSWHGTPLQTENLGAVLEEGTQVCSVAPIDSFRAVLLIDQADRDDIAEGRDVHLKLDHMPDVKLTGTVTEISDRHREYAPRALSNKYGGNLPTATDSQGREKLSGTIVYQAIVEVNQDPKMLKNGMRGHARFIVAERSGVQWLWRALRRTFHFRL